MRRCTRCIIPDTVPGVTFDDSGLCTYCRHYTKPAVLGEEALLQIARGAKGKKAAYDCIVPISGGRDSCYVLYAAKRICGLNPLAVNFDHEFRHDQAVLNMQNAARTLGVDLVTVASGAHLGKKIALHRIRSAWPLELDVTNGSLCGACTYGYVSAAYRAAQQHGVPLILWGDSSMEKTSHMNIRGTGRLKLTRFKKLLDPDFYLAEFFKWRQRCEFPVRGNPLFSRAAPVLHDGNVREVHFFDYVPWERQRIKHVIMTELGWRRPEGHVSTWRTDCLLHVLVNYYSFRLLGCSRDCFGYCNMINSGQMDRAEALAQEERMQEYLARELPRILEEDMGLSAREIQAGHLAP